MNKRKMGAGRSWARMILRGHPFAFFVLGSSLRLFVVILPFLVSPAHAQILDKQKLLDAQTFWDNRDWDWYKANIPFFESPDPDIDTTYYYRWELITKHLVYGSPATGYVYTEFMDRPFWSGRYGAISCAAGHHLDEVRWLKEPRYAQDYARYWFGTEGAQPRRYGCWINDAVWGTYLTQHDGPFIKSLLAGMKKNYQGWERERFAPEVGLFWMAGHDDGMEFNIDSRQTQDLMHGAPGYRPTLNSYLWADALAVARVAELADDADTARQYTAKAAALKDNLQKKLWDPKRNFFFHKYKNDEQRDGFTVKAGSLTYQTGKFAGSDFGREEIGFVPWQFNLPDPGYEAAWQYLMDPDHFFAPFGPSTAERKDPMFYLSPSCCWWSGQSWPYATTQTLTAMANLLNGYKQSHVTRQDYFKLLKIFALTHRKEGRPYLAEAANPDNGSFAGHDAFNHSEHYFHSAYCDLIITGLAGLRPRGDDVVEVNPLVPDNWDYFALDDVRYHDHAVCILWDKTGERYGKGAGLRLFIDGVEAASRADIGRMAVRFPGDAVGVVNLKRLINYAVNNDAERFPRAIASFTSDKTSPDKLIDGNYWYHISPPNRWTAEGSPSATDWCGVDFGIPRPIDTVKLYLLDDGQKILAPAKIDLEYWDGKAWKPVPDPSRSPAEPIGHRANVIRFPTLQAEKLRAVLTHKPGWKSGLTEFEAWGEGTLPVAPAPPPVGNLALNPTGKGFPAASASFTSRFDDVREINDGKIVFAPTPRNRWTAYESPNETDWVAIDFGVEKMVGRVDLHVYDDGGGVQAPASYTLQSWDGANWIDVPDQKKDPAKPAGGKINSIAFKPLKTAKIRVVFVHRGQSRSGLTELEAWEP